MLCSADETEITNPAAQKITDVSISIRGALWLREADAVYRKGINGFFEGTAEHHDSRSGVKVEHYFLTWEPDVGFHDSAHLFKEPPDGFGMRTLSYHGAYDFTYKYEPSSTSGALYVLNYIDQNKMIYMAFRLKSLTCTAFYLFSNVDLSYELMVEVSQDRGLYTLLNESDLLPMVKKLIETLADS
jgi:hypothetical protein